MRLLLFVLAMGIILTSIGGCASIKRPQQQVDVVSMTPTLIPASTSASPFTPTLNPTDYVAPASAAQRAIKVTELIPSDRCGITAAKSVFTTSWVNDDEFIYAYYPLVEEGSESIVNNEVLWVLHNIKTGDEIPAAPTINFDNTFWKRNQIEINAVNPELAGFFSPSGEYVIYSVFLGISFEPNARTEIWVAETKSQQKWKIFEADGNAVDIYRAAWFENETKVIFNIAYEGPTEFYVSDFKSRQTVKLSEISQFSGITEETWRLSPDGKTLAVVDLDRRFLLVSLVTGETQTVEMFGGSFPQWSDDGKFLFYWWKADKDNWWDNIDELRVYSLDGGKVSTLVDKSDLSIGFQDYQGDDNCISRDYYLAGGEYAVSPDQKALLLWNSGLYLLTR